MRSLLDNDRTTFHGDVLRHHRRTVRPASRCRTQLPILVGTGSPRMLRITARHAQEWNTWGAPDLAADRHADFVTACEAVGDRPGIDAHVGAGAGLHDRRPDAVEKIMAGDDGRPVDRRLERPDRRATRPLRRDRLRRGHRARLHPRRHLRTTAWTRTGRSDDVICATTRLTVRSPSVTSARSAGGTWRGLASATASGRKLSACSSSSDACFDRVHPAQCLGQLLLPHLAETRDAVERARPSSACCAARGGTCSRTGAPRRGCAAA